MVETFWRELLALHALIGFSVILWSLADNHVPSLFHNRFAPGIILGLVAILTMTMAVKMQPGFRFDLRYALISTSGLMFGPISGLMTGLLTGAMRTYQGGAGMLAGLVAIAISATIGTLGHIALKGRRPSVLHCSAVAITVSVCTILSLLVLPAEVRGPILKEVWLPLGTLTFSSTLFTTYFVRLEFLRKSEYRTLGLYRQIVDALPDCLNVKDVNGCFVIANKATADLMKARDASDLIGKTDFDFYPPTVAAGYRDDERKVLDGIEAQRFEQLVDFKDGKFGWLETVKVPMRDQTGEVTGLITYNRDITALHELNESKAQFASTISHEIRTPLTSICGSLGLVSNSFTDQMPPKAARLIAIADRNAQHLSEMINTMLDFEKLNAGATDFAPEMVDVGRLAEDSVSSMKHFLPNKNLSWTVSRPKTKITVMANPVRLRQVLLNLLSNAGKFAPAASIIEMEITIFDERVRLCVLDAGPGVQPKFEAALFSRFRQEKETGHLNTLNGTGLGLSLTKSFVEHMSGTVSYHRRGDCTEFRVEFPSAANEDNNTQDLHN